MNNPQLPEDVIDYIISHLRKCDICNIYCIESEIENCVSCKNIWCSKCSSHCGYINCPYFKVRLPICNKCNKGVFIQ